MRPVGSEWMPWVMLGVMWTTGPRSPCFLALQVLDALCIAHSGSGTLPGAAAAAVVEKHGVRVAFLSYADHYKEWAADTLAPQASTTFDPER